MRRQSRPGCGTLCMSDVIPRYAEVTVRREGIEMNRQQNSIGPGSARAQWGGYGFLAGMMVGLLAGWFFAGFVGAVIRVGLVAIVVVPAILLYVAWRKY